MFSEVQSVLRRARAVPVILALAACVTGGSSVRANPLDPLSAAEITKAAAILKADRHWTQTSTIASIELVEPDKQSVLGGSTDMTRRASARLLVADRAVEAVLDLTKGQVESWTDVPGRQPSFTLKEILSAVDIVKKDSGWRAAMAKRGYTDFTGIICNPLAVGYVADPALRARRLMNVPCFDAHGARNNTFARPIEGLTATVDLNSGTIVRLIDLGVEPVPADMPQHDYASQVHYRAPAKPVFMAAPEGSNIVVAGHDVRWDNWRFHIRIDRRSGPTLSLLRYDDAGKERSIAYQIAPSELFVPYMDKAPTWSFKSYLDAGEYGLGLLAAPLSPGRDCPDNAMFQDAVVAGDDGEPMTIPRALCLFERANGDPVWRHMDPFNNDVESRPENDLVIRSIAVVGNYDYIFDYVLTQAGEIEVRVGATGIDAVKGVKTRMMSDATAAADTAVGTLVAPNLVAVNHEHYIAFRLDLDIDGPNNTLVLDHFSPVKITGNPGRTSMWRDDIMVQSVEGPVSGHGHDALIRILASGPRGALGQIPSYELNPGHSAVLNLDADDPLAERGAFARNATWATLYNPREKYAGGDWPNQSPPGEGLPQYVADHQSIEGKDLVLWEVLGFRHLTRTEDWPVMPTLWHSFRLRPHNFFARNPAMDVVPPASVSGK